MPTSPTGIDFDLKGIGALLNEATFAVPTYQRSYAWKVDEIDDYWSDLQGALAANEPDYFIGSLVLTRNGERLVVIDGQQRLATTTLLFAALRTAALKRGKQEVADNLRSSFLTSFDYSTEENVPRLTLNSDDDPFFRKLILDDTPPELAEKPPESHQRLAAAHKELEERLEADLAHHGNQADQRLTKWLTFLRNGLLAIRLIVPSESDAFLIFETLNDRGADLTIGDLLKNYLFGRAKSKLETVKQHWIGSLAALDVSAENLKFITFLRQYWSSKHGLVRERELYRSIRERVTTATQAVEFSEELEQAAHLFAALENSTHERWAPLGDSGRSNIETLLRLEVEQHRPLMLAVMAHFSDAELKKALRALVSWSVRSLILGRLGGGTSEKAYCAAAVKVRKGELKTTKALLTELTAIVPSDEEFETAFQTARVTRAAIARYLLLALEKEKGGEKEPELVPNSDEDEVNLEHILPRNPTKEDWPSFEPEDFPTWIYRVGNLCLLSKGPNDKIGNQSWAVKKPILAASKLELTKMAAENDDWTAKEIAERQLALAKLAPATWPRG
ncbi:MAG TPA: DUF262 domain-containing HNH endonuclease family protein [Gaiellaceae bacterium]|nr:DUF262 domain-containing HNH endonuclease family protein [Gaiellaceae bacterium]